MTGTAGCNRYFTSYDQNGGNLTLGPIGSTRRMCPELNMLAEQRFLAALRAVSGWQMRNDQFILFGTGAELTFARTY